MKYLLLIAIIATSCSSQRMCKKIAKQQSAKYQKSWYKPQKQ